MLVNAGQGYRFVIFVTFLRFVRFIRFIRFITFVTFVTFPRFVGSFEIIYLLIFVNTMFLVSWVL